jgi:hypothetical protein
VAERRCICCGEVTNPDKLKVRADTAAPYVHTHRRPICCQAHAEVIKGLIVLLDAPRQTMHVRLTAARCEA